LGVIGIGIMVTAAVIFSGSNKGGVHESMWGDWSLLWILMKVGLGVAFLASIGGYAWMIARTKSELWVLGLAGLIPAVLGAAFFYTVIGGADVALDGPSMRILWQLMKGTIAGLVLLGGCAMVFKKRAGVVLLHAGIGLMMFSEVQVATTAIESQMVIQEEETVNFTRDIRSVELAVVTGSKPGETFNTVIPGSMLSSAVEGKNVIQHPDLPFKLKVLRFLPNSDIRDTVPGKPNLATRGDGLGTTVVLVKSGTGTDTDSAVDIASAYVQILNPDDGKPIGTWLVSQFFVKPQQVSVNGETYGVALRFKRAYKPYSVTLINVEKRDYQGTSTPRDYSSYIQLHDPANNVDRKIRIWMNNPLRFAGETFYQSGYNRQMATQLDVASGMRRPVLITDPVTGERVPKFVETTTLSVVTNSGWMIPYVSCMLVATGLLAHFLLTLIRFLNRQQRERKAAEPTFNANDELQPTVGASSPAAAHVKAARRVAKQQKSKARRAKRKQKVGGPLLGEESGPLNWIVPLVVVLVCAMWVGSKARTPRQSADRMDLYAFGKIPVVFQGRQKPLDTLARNALRVVSNRQTFHGRMTDDALRKKWPKIVSKVKSRWPELSEADLNSVDFDVDKLITLIGKQANNEDDEERIMLFVDQQVNVKQPAIRWLLDIIARPDRAGMHKVFRIENLEVLDLLGLPRRDGFRYSVDEFRERQAELEKQVELAQETRKATPESLSTFQKKILEFDTRVRTFTLLVESFRKPDLPPMPPMPSQEEFARNPEATMKLFAPFQAAFLEAKRRQTYLQNFSPPLLVPIHSELREDDKPDAGSQAGRKEWETYTTACLNNVVQQPNAPTSALQSIFRAYTFGEANEFNNSVEKYQNLLAASSDLQLAPVSKTRFEAFFNHFEPFFYSILLYLFAFLLACLSWLFWRRPLNNAASCLIAMTLLLHTFALISRIYISGRPPVTNLYSSAVFIGWGCAVFGLVLEGVFRIGIGNIVAAVAGFATMWIAHLLSGDGDTFTVLQAVLDTQFWLATHVTCITLGYATTFLAGAFGIVYVFRGSTLGAPLGGLVLAGLAGHFLFWSKLESEYSWLIGLMFVVSSIACFCLFGQTLMADKKPDFPEAFRRRLARMIYGSLCFAILFSFVGTVLGGLWADDSWGRFWGWDPKENGALIIVLWNALVLHARWGGMVKERGMAVLVIGGSIVTSWSWFGVNELGAGLHSYGFTDGVMLTLSVFVVSQLVVIGVGCLPKNFWWSDRSRESADLA
jgi:ABC-type transport system involved in cytochrome c biogenesis permease subunit